MHNVHHLIVIPQIFMILKSNIYTLLYNETVTNYLTFLQEQIIQISQLAQTVIF